MPFCISTNTMRTILCQCLTSRSKAYWAADRTLSCKATTHSYHRPDMCHRSTSQENRGLAAVKRTGSKRKCSTLTVRRKLCTQPQECGMASQHSKTRGPEKKSKGLTLLRSRHYHCISKTYPNRIRGNREEHGPM